MGDGAGGTEGRNTEVGGGIGDANIDTGNKGRDAGAHPDDLHNQVRLNHAMPACKDQT